MKERLKRLRSQVSRGVRVGSALLVLTGLFGDLSEKIFADNSRAQNRITIGDRRESEPGPRLTIPELHIEVEAIASSSGYTLVEYLNARENNWMLVPGVHVSNVNYEWGLPVSGQAKYVEHGFWLKVSDCENDQAILVAPGWFNMLMGMSADKAFGDAQLLLNDIQNRCPGMKLIVVGAPPLPPSADRGQEVLDNRGRFNEELEKDTLRRGGLFIDMEKALGSKENKQILDTNYFGDNSNHFGVKGWSKAFSDYREKITEFVRESFKK